MDSANFFVVMPLPGTPLYDLAVAEGYLTEFDADRLTWYKANLVNTAVPAEELEEMRTKAWEEINDPDWVAYKEDMRSQVDLTRAG